MKSLQQYLFHSKLSLRVKTYLSILFTSTFLNEIELCFSFSRHFIMFGAWTSWQKVFVTLTSFAWIFVIQLLSCVWFFATQGTATCQASLSCTIFWSLLKHILWVGDAIQLSHPLLPPSPALNLSHSNESTLRIRWPKYWSFTFSISPSWIFSVDFL